MIRGAAKKTRTSLTPRFPDFRNKICQQETRAAQQTMRPPIEEASLIKLNKCIPRCSATDGRAMQGSFDQPPIIVRSSRWTTLWTLLGILILAGGAVGAILDWGAGLIVMLPFRVVFGALGLVLSKFVDLHKSELHHLIAWIMLLLFGSGSLIVAHKLLWPDTLEIGPSGVHCRSFMRRWSFRWRDIGNFRPYGRSDGLAQVLVVCVGDYRPQGTAPRIKSFGLGWELEPVKLAALLNAARARWVENEPY